MSDLWTVRGSSVPYKRPWLQIREDDVEFKAGPRLAMSVVEEKLGVHILAITANDEIVIIDKPQYPSGLEHSLEIPGGGVSKDDDPLEVAKNELIGETGWEAGEYATLFSGFRRPMRDSKGSIIYLATGLHHAPDRRRVDPNEVINGILLMPLTQVLAGVNTLFADLLTRHAIYWYCKEIRKM